MRQSEYGYDAPGSARAPVVQVVNSDHLNCVTLTASEKVST